MVISCTFCLFVAFWISGCRSLVSGLFLASKMNSCGCHDMMLNLSQSERKRVDRRLSQWAAAYLHIWHKYFYGPRLKSNTLLWSWSRASQSTEGCLLKRPSAKLIPPFIFSLFIFLLSQHCQMTSKWAPLQWRADIVKCPSRWCWKRQSVPRRRLG